MEMSVQLASLVGLPSLKRHNQLLSLRLRLQEQIFADRGHVVLVLRGPGIAGLPRVRRVVLGSGSGGERDVGEWSGNEEE